MKRSKTSVLALCVDCQEQLTMIMTHVGDNRTPDDVVNSAATTLEEIHEKLRDMYFQVSADFYQEKKDAIR